MKRIRLFGDIFHDEELNMLKMEEFKYIHEMGTKLSNINEVVALLLEAEHETPRTSSTDEDNQPVAISQEDRNYR